MKRLYLVTLLSLCLPIASYAENNLADFASEMNAITKSAFAEMDQQMAVKINLAGKQRMLSQKMTKEALLISLNIDTDNNKKNLEASATLFDKTLTGLKVGDDSLGLTKTDNTSILKQLDKVSTLWNDFKTNIESTISKGSSEEALNNIATQNLPLLSAMNKAVYMYAGASGADLNKLANVINLSGKQRMLTQKMSKELLLAAKGIDKSENLEKLKATTELFDKTLKGLLDGDKGLGLPKTSDEKIRKQLGTVKELWDELKPIFEKADTSPETLEKVAKLNLPLLSEMNKAVKMYEEQSK